MKKSLRVSLSVLFLALAIAVTQIPPVPVSADQKSATVSGADLVVTKDFQMSGNTLVKYTGSDEKVVIPSYVTEIGEEAFADNTTLKSLSFAGDKVKKIGYRAFAGCNGLKELVLPDSLEELGNGAFNDCTSLASLTIGKGLRSWGVGPFSGCENLAVANVSGDNGYFSVSDGAIYNSDKKRLYLVLPARKGEIFNMPNTVEDIAEYAFWKNNNLTGIALSGNLKTIPDYAFTGCMNLTGITIPYSATSIGVRAFADCVNLEAVIIPINVASIHDTAFDGCPKLKINAETGSAAQKFYEQWQQKNQAEYEDSKDENITDDSESTEEKIEIVDETTGRVIGSTYVVGNRAVVFMDNTALDVSSTESVSSPDYVPGDSFSFGLNTDKGMTIPKYTVVNGNAIADLAFYKNTDLKSYRFPAGITSIGEFSFARSALTSVKILDGITDIGYGAFYHCDNLTSVTIPYSVTYIAPKAFEHSFWLENWMNIHDGDDFLVVGNGILLAYKGSDTDVVIPDTVKRIGSEVFAGNLYISSVTIPDSVIEIGEGAFEDCKNLKTVTGGANVTAIKDRAFAGAGLDSAHVFANVKTLGLRVFDFSNTGFGPSAKVVVFDAAAGVFPTGTHEKTAERLSNEDARGKILGDTCFAIVNSRTKVNQLYGTILDGSDNGFSGVIAYISSNNQAQVTCIACTFRESELSSIYIPDYVTIDGKTYEVLGKDSMTCLEADDEATGEGISLAGDSDVVSNISAEIEGVSIPMTLLVKVSSTAISEVGNAYKTVYREELPEGAFGYEMSLTDLKTGVPVTKFGKQYLKVTMLLPGSITADKLRVYTTDQDGQLEMLPYKVNGNKITFETSHLSPIVFVNVGSSSAAALDASPDTGDKSIHPKWFVAIGFVALSLAVLLVGRGKPRKKAKAA